LRLLGSREDAEDVLQETFLNAFRAINSFRGDSSFSTWIYRIATNNALMKLRKSGRVELEFNDELPNISVSEDRPPIGHIESPVDALFEKELLSELDQAVGKLPEKYRTIFLLRDVEEFSTEETAEILGITESAVKSRLHRARLFLRESLGHLMQGGALG
jgi:RNA polymerase sigma-70 factor (ECF subfamily)